MSCCCLHKHAQTNTHKRSSSGRWVLCYAVRWIHSLPLAGLFFTASLSHSVYLDAHCFQVPKQLSGVHRRLIWRGRLSLGIFSVVHQLTDIDLPSWKSWGMWQMQAQPALHFIWPLVFFHFFFFVQIHWIIFLSVACQKKHICRVKLWFNHRF